MKSLPRHHGGFRPLVLFCLLASVVATANAQGPTDLFLGTGAGNPGVSTGSRDTALGVNSLASLTSGSDNTAVGYSSLSACTFAGANTAVGSFALANNTSFVNTAVGAGSQTSTTTGNSNTSMGANSLTGNTTGSANTAVGFGAMQLAQTGGNNTALGSNALVLNRSGNGNIAIGVFAGQAIVTGSDNIEIGNQAPADESDTIRIGVNGTQTATFLAGVNGATIASGSQVFVDANGQLGTITSSIRFKEDVEDMGDASLDLMKLRPVTFHYKAPYDDGSHLQQYGLIAEEVAKVRPDLVQLDAKGQPLTVRYHAVNAMLLNEVQRQNGKLETQETELGELRSLVAAQKELLASQEARLKKLEALLAGQPAAPKLQ